MPDDRRRILLRRNRHRMNERNRHPEPACRQAGLFRDLISIISKEMLKQVQHEERQPCKLQTQNILRTVMNSVSGLRKTTTNKKSCGFYFTKFTQRKNLYVMLKLWKNPYASAGLTASLNGLTMKSMRSATLQEIRRAFGQR